MLVPWKVWGRPGRVWETTPLTHVFLTHLGCSLDQETENVLSLEWGYHLLSRWLIIVWLTWAIQLPFPNSLSLFCSMLIYFVPFFPTFLYQLVELSPWCLLKIFCSLLTWGHLLAVPGCVLSGVRSFPRAGSGRSPLPGEHAGCRCLSSAAPSYVCFLPENHTNSPMFPLPEEAFICGCPHSLARGRSWILSYDPCIYFLQGQIGPR